MKKLKINAGKLRNLPVFYNHVVYNELQDTGDPFYKIIFSDKLNCYIDYKQPDKLISKIIDLSKLK